MRMMSPRLEFALNVAWDAAKSTLAHFQTGATIDWKHDDSPVTVADREAEAIIRRGIASRFPGETVLGEEEGLTGASDDRWVIDPIDGTKSFISGVPLYSTLLSYEVAGEPVLGVCILPALGQAVWAERGSGAYWDGVPIRVRAQGELNRAVLACGGHRSLLGQGRMEGFLDLVPQVLATRTWGDAYGHAMVAAGRIDAMIDPVVARWDISAMAVIVREAGGLFTDFEGNEELADEAISASPDLHRHILEAFRA